MLYINEKGEKVVYVDTVCGEKIIKMSNVSKISPYMRII
jgi:hypothetical protein